jgi:hypothetical protein
MCAMFLQKKAGLGKKSWFVTAASHGFGVDCPGLRRPGRTGGRLSGSESLSLRRALSLSIYLSLPRLSSRVSEALSESPDSPAG